MTDKPHLFYNNSKCCLKLLEILKLQNINDNFIYHDVSDPNVLKKLPPSFTTVPILIVKYIAMPLIGKEVFNWIETQKYIGLTANNITKSMNPEFRTEQSNGQQYIGNFCAINDEDDDKVNNTMVKIKDWDKLQITDMNKRFIDNKLSCEIQQQKLKLLMEDRNIELNNIMNSHKKF